VKVVFTKLGGRRYRVDAITSAHHWQMPQAPGWDEAMPHDLAHFLSEREEGIRLGIFGQLAAGGSAGTFQDGAPNTAQRRRSDRLGRAGRDDVARSERLAAGVRGYWSARTGRPERSALPVDLVGPRLAAAVVDTAERWRAVPDGGSLELDWPDSLLVRDANGAGGRQRDRGGRRR
jgi:hypothetical protein